MTSFAKEITNNTKDYLAKINIKKAIDHYIKVNQEYMLKASKRGETQYTVHLNNFYYCVREYLKKHNGNITIPDQKQVMPYLIRYLDSYFDNLDDFIKKGRTNVDNFDIIQYDIAHGNLTFDWSNAIVLNTNKGE